MDDFEKKSMHIFKVIIVGDISVGKTALAVRYVKDYFSETYESTPGINLLRKVIEEKDKTIILDIWDTGGQEKFNYLRSLYYKGASGALVCYDITNRKSFKNVPFWLGEVDKNCGEVPVFLVANKKDLESKRAVN
ncbi:MAG: Rab family GTPase, partial [Candidatus Asgardarchaeia archaeon]